MVGFVVMLSDLFTRTLFFGRRSGRKNERGGNAILMLIGLVLLILAPIFGTLMQFALSRKREFLADATAIELTRNPDGLISALQKLDLDRTKLDTANSATAHMYIVNPLKSERKKLNWFSTHPSIDKRIESLKNLK